MNCAWKAYLNLLPVWMRNDVDKFGADILEELRMRVGHPPCLVLQNRVIFLNKEVTADDLSFCINAASKYSPWAATTIRFGYITANGGHRIGVCGDAILNKENHVEGIRTINMLCLRVAKDYRNVSKQIPVDNKSVLIVGSPGAGKTTLLRDLIRRYSETDNKSIGVVDERGELFPITNGKYCFPTGPKTDVLTWTSKQQGIEMLLRSMNPGVIAVDEITNEEDCRALLQAGWCGVNIFATAHASGIEDLHSRAIYKHLLDSKLFDIVTTVNSDRTLCAERVGDLCFV